LALFDPSIPRLVPIATRRLLGRTRRAAAADKASPADKAPPAGAPASAAAPNGN